MSPRTPETASPQTASQQSGEPAPAPEQRAVQRPWLVVLLRELGVKARDRSVLISTAVTLALIVGGLVLSSVLSERSAGTAYDLAAVGDGAAAMAEAAVEHLGGEDRAAASFILRYAFAFLFYMAAIMFGVAIANSVLEEKQNRVVEILATAIPVRQILYGKVLGNCVMAFVQMGLYAGVGLLVATALGLSDGLGWAMSASGWFIAFVVGFAAQAAIWAALGSLASRSEDLSTSMTPIMTVLVAAMMVGMFASGPWLAIASYIPIMSSIAMPVRLLEGEAAAWEPIASLAVCLVFGWVMLRIGEKVYQRAVFQGGRSLSWRQALQLED